MATYLVVDIYTIQTILDNPGCDGVGGGNRVLVTGRRRFGRAKGRDDELDASLLVVGLGAFTLSVGQAGPGLGLVCRAGRQQEGECEDIVSLEVQNVSEGCSRHQALQERTLMAEAAGGPPLPPETHLSP